MNLEQFLAMEASSDADENAIDLRGLDCVSSYDDHLMCPICHCPFVHPVRLECDHVFCRSCLNTAINITHTGFAVRPEDFPCPTCRTPSRDIYLNVPRLLINMCDDIRVRCPFSGEGCDEIIPRGHVQSHADKYCQYKPMDCPSQSCDKKTRKKDLHPDGNCMHELHKCLRCEEDIMEQDYQEHVQELCPSLKTTCPDCQVELPREVLKEHVETCPETIHPCAASKYGCPVKLKRSELVAHEQYCQLVTMSPYFEAQNSRLESLELKIRHLQQRNEIYEDGLANIRSTFVESSRVLSTHIADMSSNPSNPSERPPTAPRSVDDQVQLDGSSNVFTNATTYLLSLHESLREEVNQLSHAITDLDARASMAIMNECLRIKEDMAHTNAAVGSIRMQVQWLMNPRIHHAQRTANNAQTNDTRTAHLGSPTPGPSNSAGPSPGLLRPRRLSDSGREGTKL